MPESGQETSISKQGLSYSLSELYPRYYNRVFAFAYGRLADRDNALDLTQEVFLRFIKTNPQPSQIRSSIPAYLLGIARKALADFWSDRLKLPQEDMVAVESIPQHLNEPWIEKLALERCVQQLKAVDRRILQLHFLEGQNHKETASRLAMRHGQVRQRFSRALEQLRKCLGTRGRDRSAPRGDS